MFTLHFSTLQSENNSQVENFVHIVFFNGEVLLLYNFDEIIWLPLVSCKRFIKTPKGIDNICCEKLNLMIQFRINEEIFLSGLMK